MKPQPVTSALFPTALAVASISLALLLLPGGGTSSRPSGLAPALKLVAGDVVAAVQPPAPETAKAKPRTVVHQTTPVTNAPERKQPAAVTSSPATVKPAPLPVRHSPVHHAPAPLKASVHPTHTTQAKALPAPAPVQHGNGKGIGHSNGKGKALARLPKPAPSPASASHGKGHGLANGRSGAVHAHSVNTPHGPPAVPPGHAYGRGGVKQGLPHGPGGRK